MLNVPQPPDAKAAPRRGRGLWRRVVWAVAALVLAFVGGFFWFALQVPRLQTSFDRTADGIVALTGGRERIADAVELLAAGRGKRLLISGVHPTTRAEEVSRQLPRYQAMFTCCIDLDRSATNTIGNAIETRRWVRERGFRSVIVVTSAYHMPRAQAEIAHQLPDVALIPFPVVTERERAAPWWSNFHSARTLAIEYVKYLAAVVRMRIIPGYGETG